MLSVQNITFSYNKFSILEDLSFSLEKGKTMAVIGESGCGKSTLLKLIYGLYDLNEGQIFWNKNEVLGPKYHLIPGMDYMKYLAQDFDLMPYITVAENVGKYLSNIYKDKKNQRVSELLEIVEMTEFATVKAQFLSGGQMQRVALARVLALEPEVLLLDEPFSHIDNFRKNSLRRKLFAYLKEKQITTIIATHDSTDVLSFADEVLVMKNGKIIEKGSANYLYENPKNKYIASLFGDVNEIEIDGKLQLVYPHQLEIVEQSTVEVEVLQSFFRGNHFLVEATFQKNILYFESHSSLEKGAKVFLQVKK
ncbi:ABC transporter ATP-binding protein [Flavobacterium macrobrachii]|uniref:ABC transporter ATP-binding protein n=1 Tax=Flavobacterium macrobrachii TaxID=591204 RepID=A0ABS2CTY8_9FLAO|nr:ABC transporter ATP-binding protein [Flavobacterium macrobrachii]MBM6498426.1 ABC transporter ATP-binding protein [Flavobacterium macrobrachii]